MGKVGRLGNGMGRVGRLGNGMGGSGSPGVDVEVGNGTGRPGDGPLFVGAGLDEGDWLAPGDAEPPGEDG